MPSALILGRNFYVSAFNEIRDPSVIEVGHSIIQVVGNFADDGGATNSTGGDRTTS